MTLSAVKTIGAYVIDRELGRGAFGAVYSARHRDRPDWPVALKVIDAGGGDPARLLAEPALLAQVKHPCVVGVEDYFTADGRLAIALEFVNGEDLKVALDRGDAFTPEQVRTLLIQLGGALAAAHAQQIVHRDIKPANILVDRSGGGLRFVLTDFGIGRRQEGVQAEKHAGGTYHFMAPEQLRGRPGPQSDLWALGVVAYRLLAGRLPFPGSSLPELARQIQYVSPLPPSEVRGEPLPADLEAAVLKLLDKSLNERTASAEQLLKDLGYTGDSRKVTQAPARTGATSRRQEPMRRRLERAVTRNRWKLAVCILLYTVPNKVLTGSLILAGIALFIAGQSADRSRGRWRTWGVTAAALAVFLLANLWGLFGRDIGVLSAVGYTDGPPWAGGSVGVRPPGPRITPARVNDSEPTNLLQAVLPSLALIGMGLLGFVAPIIGSAAFADLRRARREQALWDAAREGSARSDRFLTTMRAMVDTRLEDVGFHLKYAELLFARGDHRAAAVEARLLLIQDSYHFNGNLLLANAYAALGLWADCLTVCDEYLQVAGYCFEFAELKQQCLERLGPP